jgi:hypothetical protein
MKSQFVLLPLLSGIVAATGSAFAAAPLGNFNASVSTYNGVGPATTTVYNANGSANIIYTSANEFGDQITVAGGANQVFAGISFEYYANYAQAGGLSLNLYRNDGAGGAPSTLLDSRTLDVVNGGGIANVSLSYNASNQLPSSFTYAVQFSGIGGSNIAGLIAGDAVPSVGTSLNDFWEKNGGTWGLKNLSGGAGPVVPEPSTIALFSVAGVGLAGALFGRRNRK